MRTGGKRLSKGNRDDLLDTTRLKRWIPRPSAKAREVMIGAGRRVVDWLINQTDCVIVLRQHGCARHSRPRSDREEKCAGHAVVFKPNARFSALRWSPELNPVKVRVEATNPFKQHMLIYSNARAGSCRGVGAISAEPHSFPGSRSMPAVVGSTNNNRHYGQIRGRFGPQAGQSWSIRSLRLQFTGSLAAGQQPDV